MINKNRLHHDLEFWRKKKKKYMDKIKINYTYDYECFIHMINEKIEIIEEELKNGS